ncbi:MAG: hypothetical protein JNL01_13365 [Bdellovibrionales bacterium]|nr:hypothetical protein [Bdellovibrionales bacterium]
MTQFSTCVFGTILFTFLSSNTEAAQTAKTITLKGNVYEWTSKGRGDLLFRQTRIDTEKTDDTGTTSQTESLYTDTVGRTVVRESMQAKNGKPTFFFFERLQTEESGKIEVRDGKAQYSYTKQGKTKTDVSDAGESFVFPPSFLIYVQTRWKEFLDGQSISMRLAVLERLEDFGFKFFKVSESKVQGKTLYEAKLKPTSLLIAAIVDPIEFTLDEEKIVKRVKGRMPMKKKVGEGEFEDFVGEIIYE